MKTFKTTAVAALALASITLGALPAFALEGDTANSELTIDVKATELNMTVPGEAAVLFNEDETVTVPTNFDISNNSEVTAVSLTRVALDGGSDWVLASDAKDLKQNGSDTKEARIKLGAEGKLKVIAPTEGNSAATGEATWANGEQSFAPSSTTNIKFEVERGAFSEAVAKAKAYDMTLNFEFTK